MCLGMCTLVRMPLKARGIESTVGGMSCSCELLHMGTGDQTQMFHRSSACPQAEPSLQLCFLISNFICLLLHEKAVGSAVERYLRVLSRVSGKNRNKNQQSMYVCA